MVHAHESNVHRKTVVETPFAYEDLFHLNGAIRKVRLSAPRRLEAPPISATTA